MILRAIEIVPESRRSRKLSQPWQQRRSITRMNVGLTEQTTPRLGTNPCSG
jgi:hypothetical protein